MPRPSSIDQMPEEIRSEIGRLRMQGCTIDAIVAHLQTLYGKAPSRSALGRHIQGLDKLGERLRRTRQISEVLVAHLGDAPESRAASINIELVHNAIFDMFQKAVDAEEGVCEGASPTLGVQEAMVTAKALDHLTRASKTNVDFIAAAEKRATERAKKAAAVAVETVGRERGLSADTLDAIKAGIFGVAA